MAYLSRSFSIIFGRPLRRRAVAVAVAGLGLLSARGDLAAADPRCSPGARPCTDGSEKFCDLTDDGTASGPPCNASNRGQVFGEYYGYVSSPGNVLWPAGGEEAPGDGEFKVWAEYMPGYWLKRDKQNAYTAMTEADELLYENDRATFEQSYTREFLSGKVVTIGSEEEMKACTWMSYKALEQLAVQGLAAQEAVALFIEKFKEEQAESGGNETPPQAKWIPRSELVNEFGTFSLRDSTHWVYVWLGDEVPSGQPRVLAEFPIEFGAIVKGTAQQPLLSGVPEPITPAANDSTVERLNGVPVKNSVLFCGDDPEQRKVERTSYGTFGYLIDYFRSHTAEQVKNGEGSPCGSNTRTDYKVAQQWETTADPWKRFRGCPRLDGVRETWGAIVSAEIDVPGHYVSGDFNRVFTNGEGGYSLHYLYPKGFLGVVNAYAKLRLGPFDAARGVQRQYTYRQSTLWGAYDDASANLDDRQSTFYDPFLIPPQLTHRFRTMHFPISVAALTANVVFSNSPPQALLKNPPLGAELTPEQREALGNLNAYYPSNPVELEAWASESGMVEVAHPQDGDAGRFPGDLTSYEETPPIAPPVSFKEIAKMLRGISRSLSIGDIAVSCVRSLRRISYIRIFISSK